MDLYYYVNYWQHLLKEQLFSLTRLGLLYINSKRNELLFKKCEK